VYLQFEQSIFCARIRDVLDSSPTGNLKDRLWNTTKLSNFSVRRTKRSLFKIQVSGKVKKKKTKKHAIWYSTVISTERVVSAFLMSVSYRKPCDKALFRAIVGVPWSV